MSRLRLRHETRVAALALAAGLPALAATAALLARSDVGAALGGSIAVLCAAAWLTFGLSVRARVARPLETLSNVLVSFREGDFSLRVRETKVDDALGAVTGELNALGDELRKKRLEAMEASALLEKIVASIDVAVFAFDDLARVRLVNDAAERLLGRSPAPRVGRLAIDVDLADLLEGEAPRLVVFPAGVTERELRRFTFRLEGRVHTLVILTPVEHALRQREREAWQRLLRVLGHEINNSLAPIRSIAESSKALVARTPASDASADLARGLEVIAGRAEALLRFSSSFSEVGRLPSPRLSLLDVGSWIARVVALETRVAVTLEPGPRMIVRGDADQLDQLLINLVRNAADAVLDHGSGGVAVTWSASADELVVQVIDEGRGLLDAENLFVPFFTTKPGGSGIGLVLARQIAEGHGGRVGLKSRENAQGCEATLVLPR